MPEIDDSYDGIRWNARETDWIDYDPRIGIPTIQYIEIANLNPFGEDGLTYDHPMTTSDWKEFFFTISSSIFLLVLNWHREISQFKLYNLLEK